ncbi:endonuclease-reverse transcriptase [Elysia marginata]|uniref:Endonuclease-reverse transcriptase n=1 Tax=Elysia marginata TaxID=1093978 RepID=A0AAV4I9J1_9GAST|nr:endonuclease-reverse transcriptase [Elysia marginata]
MNYETGGPQKDSPLKILWSLKSFPGHRRRYTVLYSLTTCKKNEWQPRNGKRSRGRQARRWRDDIVRTMGNTWTREAKDREEWRRDVEGFILQWMDGA